MKVDTSTKLSTRHSTMKAPDNDYFVDILRKDIEDFRMQSFETFGVDVCVHPVSDASPVYDLQGRWRGFDEYAFDVHGLPEKRMEVRISATDEVKIWYRNRWTRIARYMKHLTPPIDWNAPGDGPRYRDRQLRWDQQGRWWLANGKKFRLLDLPSEIREMIYGFAFGPVVEPYPTCKARRLNGLGKMAMVARKPNSNLLLISNQVYEEASNILFLYTPFLVQHYGVLGALTSNIAQRSRIRQLELTLSHETFLKLFRTTIKGEDGKQIIVCTRQAYALRCMKLNRLELQITAPSMTNESGWLDGACQKTVVDWILDRAWPLVRGHPVQVTGFVKTRQKAAFEAACLVERKRVEIWKKQKVAAGVCEDLELSEYDRELDDEDGGVILNERARDVMAKEGKGGAGFVEITEHTPICRCTVPCTVEHWTPEE